LASNRSDSAKVRPAGVDDLTALDRPIPAGVNAAGFGSDVAADALRATEIPYIALNPGASYRGLHDSLVNYLGNERPQMLLCLHEESAVAIAHGYAKVTGKAMAAAVHSNVGLMHATMAIFNAWCDRMPMVILGATGPVDAVKRRPWIDWIHTARDQGAREAWFVDADGYVTEGSSSNAWIVTKDRKLVTRPADHAILRGISRTVLLDAIRAQGLVLDERAFTVDEAMAAQEAFVTSASQIVLPVVRIDGRPLGTGMPGPIATALRREFHRHAEFS